ncbi:MAG TPA: hypothetical protein VGH88_16230 [Streptosporangiaceae bacterium]
MLLAAGLVLRVLAELAYRPALFYIDTNRYLYDAQGNDPVGYKGLLKAVLLVGNFDAVAAVQHVLGLAMAVVIYLLLLRRGVARWLAALAMAPVLLDGYQLQNEQTIMPGTLFQALLVAGVAILLWSPRITWPRAVAAGLALGASATVAQVGEALILPAVLFVLVAGRDGGWRRAAGRAAALIAGCAVPILAYSAGSLALTGSFALSHTGVTSFYGRTAAAADCATLRLPAPERGLCPTPAQQARGPDWLEYNAASPVRPYYSDVPRPLADRELSDFNHQVLTQQPGRLLGAYGRDVLKLFAVTRTTSPGDTPISRWQFQESYPYFTSHATRKFARTATARFGGGAPAVWRPAAAFLRSYQLGGGYTPGPVLALLTLTGLAGAGAAFARRRAGPGAGPGGPGAQAPAGPPLARQQAQAALLFFGTGAFVTLVSDLFEFSWRYQLPVLVTLVPAGILGISVIAGAVARRRGARPGRAAAAAAGTGSAGTGSAGTGSPGTGSADIGTASTGTAEAAPEPRSADGEGGRGVERVER